MSFLRNKSSLVTSFDGTTHACAKLTVKNTDTTTIVTPTSTPSVVQTSAGVINGARVTRLWMEIFYGYFLRQSQTIFELTWDCD